MKDFILFVIQYTFSHLGNIIMSLNSTRKSPTLSPVSTAQRASLLNILHVNPVLTMQQLFVQ